MARSTGLFSLPNELLTSIAELADPADLPSLRFTSRRLRDCSSTYFKTTFFERLAVSFSEDGLRILEEVTTHEVFGPAVHEILLDGTLLEDVERFKRRGRSRGIDRDESPDESLELEQMKIVLLQRHEDCEKVQARLTGTNAELHSLTRSLTSLSAYRHPITLGVTVRDYCLFEPLIGKRSFLKELARADSYEGLDSEDVEFYTRVPTALINCVQAAELSGIQVKGLKLDFRLALRDPIATDFLHPGSLGQLSAAPRSSTLGSITRLDLRIDSKFFQCDVFAVAEFLRSAGKLCFNASALKSLTLTSDVGIRQASPLVDAQTSLVNVMLSMKGLEEVAITGLDCLAYPLAQAVGAHQKTLRSLQLHCIWMDFAKAWPTFLNTLSDLTILEKLVISPRAEYLNKTEYVTFASALHPDESWHGRENVVRGLEDFLRQPPSLLYKVKAAMEERAERRTRG